MESLYRKYRPLTFESVVGQQNIVSTLENAVTEGRLSHAYLFCGPRGTGKTTMARILAKALLCEKAADAPAGTGCLPDGTCEECEAIAAGTHPDVYELDAASRTGVDNVREEIINSVNFAPVRGKYKVYVVDEVHMLSTAAFNALLKTLEEPPAHVVFVLCTTDPQKLPETILSRCQRFDFHRIANEEIVERMRFICESEGFAYDAEALEIVARHARGGMRDALSTLEQLSVFGDGAVRADDARSLLGEVASTVLADFARAIAARDVVRLFDLVRTQVEDGNDLMEFTRDLVGHVRDVYMARVAGTRPELFEGMPADQVEELGKEAAEFEGPNRLARVLTVLDDAALEMRNASDVRLVLEIALTRLARPEADVTLEALAERVNRLERQLAGGGAPAVASGARQAGEGSPIQSAAGRPATARPAAATVQSATAASRSSSPLSAAQPASRRSVPSPASDRPAPSAAAGQPAPASGRPAPRAARPEPQRAAAERSSQAPRPAVDRPAVEHPNQAVRSSADLSSSARSAAERPVQASRSAAEVAASAAPATPPVSDAGELQRKWADVVKRVTAAQASRGALLQNSRALADDGAKLTVGFPPRSTFALKMIERADSQNLVLPIVCAVFGSRQVVYTMGEGPSGNQPAPSAFVSQAVPAPPVPSVPASPAASAPAVAAPATPASPASARPAMTKSERPAPASAPASPAPARPAASAPAPMPAPAQPVSSASKQASVQAPAPAASQAPAQVDHVTGPTVVPEPDVDADRRAWEEDQVPYDDATIASYEEDDSFDVPFDVPAAQAPDPQMPGPAQSVPSSVSAQSAPSAASVNATREPAPQATAPTEPAPQATAPTQPAPSSTSTQPVTSGGMPWATHPGAEDEVPQNEDEAKDMLTSIFGVGVTFKPADE